MCAFIPAVVNNKFRYEEIHQCDRHDGILSLIVENGAVYGFFISNDNYVIYRMKLIKNSKLILHIDRKHKEVIIYDIEDVIIKESLKDIQEYCELKEYTLKISRESHFPLNINTFSSSLADSSMKKIKRAAIELL